RRDTHGAWSVVADQGNNLGQVYYPWALAANTTGTLYVADDGHGIQQWDAQGRWAVIAGLGDAPGEFQDPSALAVDAAGTLYVMDWLTTELETRSIHRRDAQGNWRVITPGVTADSLAVDGAGNLYVSSW